MSDRRRILTTSDGWVTPLAVWRATAGERARALAPLQSSRIPRDLRRNAGRHDLLVLYEVATGMRLQSPRDLKDDELVAAVESAMSNGRVLFIPGRDPEHRTARHPLADGPRETDQDRLVKSVMGERSAMEFEGHRYHFVAADGSRRQVEQSGYRLMPETQARALVTRMATRIAKSPEERASWQQLAAELTDRRDGAGVLLTRYVPTPRSNSGQTDAPAVTPSRARPQVALRDWIEIGIEYKDGSPFDGNCLVELPDGRKTEGAPDEDGVVRVRGIDPGSCKVSFPTLDASAWAPG